MRLLFISVKMAAAVGLELLYASIESQIRSQYDALVCCLHWNMIQNDFKCIGTGEQPSQESSDIKKSELLPPGWNNDTDAYILRYRLASTNEQATHILKIIRMSDTLLVHVLRQSDERMTNMTIETTQYVDAEHLGDFNNMFKDIQGLQDRFKKEIISDLKETTSSSSTAATERSTLQQREGERQDQEPDPLRLPNRRAPPRRNEPPEWGEPSNPFAVGEGDLDPFSVGGPGMFMDPMRGNFPRGGIPPGGGMGMPGRLPRGAIPPGARFDPIGPPHPDPSRNPNARFSGEPDPDHMPPPGYDDMYM